MPITASGSNSQPVSSRASRRTASRKFSEGSRCPAGLLSTRRPRTSSSTMRKRPSRSATAATVTCGFQIMSLYTEPAGLGIRLRLVPDAIERPEVQTCVERGFRVGIAFVLAGDGAVEDACFVRQQECLAERRMIDGRTAYLDVT